MKREELTALNVPDEFIDKIMEINGRDIEKHKIAAETAGTQLAEANKTIDGFKSMNIDEIKKEAEKWKEKAETTEREAKQKIADMEFNTLLNSAIGSAKGKNGKAVSALLDVETLKQSKNQGEDIKNAIDALKEENGYLFDTQTPPPYAAGTGTAQAGGKYSPEDVAMRTAMGLKCD